MTKRISKELNSFKYKGEPIKITIGTLIEGTDLDFNGNPYRYIEIKEIPSFAFCAKTREKALENYKKQLRLSLMLMLEDGDHIIEPGEETEDDIDWESICP